MEEIEKVGELVAQLSSAAKVELDPLADLLARQNHHLIHINEIICPFLELKTILSSLSIEDLKKVQKRHRVINLEFLKNVLYLIHFLGLNDWGKTGEVSLNTPSKNHALELLRLLYLDQDSLEIRLEDRNVTLNYSFEKFILYALLIWSSDVGTDIPLEPTELPHFLEETPLLKLIEDPTRFENFFKALPYLAEWIEAAENDEEYLSRYLCMHEFQPYFLSDPVPEACTGLYGMRAAMVSLNLIYYKGTSLPNCMHLFENLEELNLSSTIKILPESISTLTKLKVLEITDLSGAESQNTSYTLPEGFKHLKHIERFILSILELKELPKEISELNRLTELNLSGCPIENFPESIGNLKQLHTLTLRYGKLKGLPDSFRNLKALKWLNLENNELVDFPEVLLDLPSLVYLNLVGNSLSSIPASINQISSLIELGLYDNPVLSNADLMSKLRANLAENVCLTGWD